MIDQTLNDRFEKSRNGVNCLREGIRTVCHPILAKKGLPLGRFRFVPHEGFGKGDRLGRNVGVALREGFRNRSRQRLAVEIELPGKKADIPEILHAAIHNTMSDHRLELLGNRALPTVSTDLRRRQIENGGIGHQLWKRNHNVAEPNIKLNGDPRGIQRPAEADTHPFVVCVFGDPLSSKTVRIENNPILLHLLTAYLADHGDDGFRVVLHPSQHVDVHRGA